MVTAEVKIEVAVEVKVGAGEGGGVGLGLGVGEEVAADVEVEGTTRSLVELAFSLVLSHFLACFRETFLHIFRCEIL